MESDARARCPRRPRPVPLGTPQEFQGHPLPPPPASAHDIGAIVMTPESEPLFLCRDEFGIENGVCSTEARSVQALQRQRHRQQQQEEEGQQQPRHSPHPADSSGYGQFHSINVDADETEPLLSPDATPISSAARSKRASFPFFPVHHQQHQQHQQQQYQQQGVFGAPPALLAETHEHENARNRLAEGEKAGRSLPSMSTMMTQFREHRSEVVAVACVSLVLFAVAVTIPFTAQKTCHPRFVQTISLLQRDEPYSSKWSMAVEVITNAPRHNPSSGGGSSGESGSSSKHTNSQFFDGHDVGELSDHEQEQQPPPQHWQQPHSVGGASSPAPPSPSSSSSATPPSFATDTKQLPLPRDMIYGIPDWAPSVLLVDAATDNAVTSSMSFGGSLSDSWSCGVLAPNGKIYGIPYNANSVLVIDPSTNTADITSIPVGHGTAQWSTGVLAGTRDLIFAIPLSATAVLVIDPSKGTIDDTSMAGFDAGCCKWVAAVLEPSTNKIFAVPADVSSVLVVDPNTLTTDTTTLASFDPTPAGWTAAVLAGKGMVFAVPGAATSVLVIDTHKNTTDTTSISGLSAVPSKWSSAVLAPTGKVFMIPHAADAVLIVDPITLTAERMSLRMHKRGLHATEEELGVAYGEGADGSGDSSTSTSTSTSTSISSGKDGDEGEREAEGGHHAKASLGTPRGDGWTAPVYDPETGLLFAMPTKRPKQTHNHRYHFSRVLVIDPLSEEAKLVSLPLRDGGWSHALLSKNGKIYAVPGDAPFAIVIDPTLVHTCPHI